MTAEIQENCLLAAFSLVLKMRLQHEGQIQVKFIHKATVSLCPSPAELLKNSNIKATWHKHED